MSDMFHNLPRPLQTAFADSTKKVAHNPSTMDLNNMDLNNVDTSWLHGTPPQESKEETRQKYLKLARTRMQKNRAAKKTTINDSNMAPPDFANDEDPPPPPPIESPAPPQAMVAYRRTPVHRYVPQPGARLTPQELQALMTSNDAQDRADYETRDNITRANLEARDSVMARHESMKHVIFTGAGYQPVPLDTIQEQESSMSNSPLRLVQVAETPIRTQPVAAASRTTPIERTSIPMKTSTPTPRSQKAPSSSSRKKSATTTGSNRKSSSSRKKAATTTGSNRKRAASKLPPKNKQARVEPSTDLIIAPHFAFVERNAHFGKDVLVMDHEAGGGRWAFDLGTHVTSILQKLPEGYNVYLHGHRDEEYQTLPDLFGLKQGVTVPYFVAMCVPRGAPAPRHVFVKDANLKTDTVTIRDMNSLSLKWKCVHDDKVYMLESSLRKTKVAVAALSAPDSLAMNGGDVIIPSAPDYSGNPFAEWIWETSDDEFFVDNYVWEEKILEPITKALGKSDLTMKDLWSLDEDAMFDFILPLALKHFFEHFEEDISKDEYQEEVENEFRVALIAHKNKIEDEASLHAEFGTHGPQVRYFKIYPENEILKKVLFTGECAKINAGRASEVFPTFGSRPSASAR